jgi:hypothetical protein
VEQNYSVSADPDVLKQPGYQEKIPINAEEYDSSIYHNIPGRSVFRRIGYRFVTDMEILNRLAEYDTIKEEDDEFDNEFDHILNKHLEDLVSDNKATKKANKEISKPVLDEDEFSGLLTITTVLQYLLEMSGIVLDGYPVTPLGNQAKFFTINDLPRLKISPLLGNKGDVYYEDLPKVVLGFSCRDKDGHRSKFYVIAEFYQDSRLLRISRCYTSDEHHTLAPLSVFIDCLAIACCAHHIFLIGSLSTKVMNNLATYDIWNIPRVSSDRRPVLTGADTMVRDYTAQLNRSLLGYLFARHEFRLIWSYLKPSTRRNYITEYSLKHGANMLISAAYKPSNDEKDIEAARLAKYCRILNFLSVSTLETNLEGRILTWHAIMSIHEEMRSYSQKSGGNIVIMKTDPLTRNEVRGFADKSLNSMEYSLSRTNKFKKCDKKTKIVPDYLKRRDIKDVNKSKDTSFNFTVSGDFEKMKKKGLPWKTLDVDTDISSWWAKRKALYNDFAQFAPGLNLDLNDDLHIAVLVEAIAQLDMKNKNNKELLQVIVPALINEYQDNQNCTKELTGKSAKVAKEWMNKSIHKRDCTLSDNISINSEISDGTSLVKSSIEHENASSCRGLVPIENSTFTLSRSFDLRALSNEFYIENLKNSYKIGIDRPNENAHVVWPKCEKPIDFEQPVVLICHRLHILCDGCARTHFYESGQTICPSCHSIIVESAIPYNVSRFSNNLPPNAKPGTTRENYFKENRGRICWDNEYALFYQYFRGTPMNDLLVNNPLHQGVYFMKVKDIKRHVFKLRKIEYNESKELKKNMIIADLTNLILMMEDERASSIATYVTHFIEQAWNKFFMRQKTKDVEEYYKFKKRLLKSAGFDDFDVVNVPEEQSKDFLEIYNKLCNFNTSESRSTYGLNSPYTYSQHGSGALNLSNMNIKSGGQSLTNSNDLMKIWKIAKGVNRKSISTRSQTNKKKTTKKTTKKRDDKNKEVKEENKKEVSGSDSKDDMDVDDNDEEYVDDNNDMTA